MSAQAETLDEIFKGVKTCSFRHFYYSPWDKNQGHSYFTNRSPVDNTKSDTYVFKVTDMLLGLPVVELQVPGTWGFHSVTFDVPIKVAQKVLRKKLGTDFPRSKTSLAGLRPALEQSTTNPNQSALYCNEPEEGV